MPKRFEADAYVARWDARIRLIMIGVILVSLVLAITLNIATRPDCLRHEYIFCGSSEVHPADEEGVTHGNPQVPKTREHGAAPH